MKFIISRQLPLVFRRRVLSSNLLYGKISPDSSDGHIEINERKIIDRKSFADLAKEVNLNASHLEALGESRQWEIVVGGDMLERLVEIQHRFERLAVMGDDEYRGLYIEVPRPTPEEWGDAEELIAPGEYDSREAFLADWLAFNPMETRWFHVASSRYGDFRSIRVTDRKRTNFIITNSSKCADAEPDDTWCRENLTRLFDYLERMIDVVVANPDGFNDYVTHNLPYQQRIGRISQKEFNRIVPNCIIEVEDKETAIKALEDSADNIDTVIASDAVTCCMQPWKFFTIDASDEPEYEIRRIIESHLGLICAHEGI